MPTRAMFSKLPVYMQRLLKVFFSLFRFFHSVPLPHQTSVSATVLLPLSIDTDSYRKELRGMLVSELTASGSSSSQSYSFTNGLRGKQYGKKKCACFMIPYEKKRSTFAWYIIADECL